MTAANETQKPRPRPRPARGASEPTRPLGREESVALGKARRSQVPREAHAAYDASAKRPDPIRSV
jgi:hypothetical protein